MCPRAQSVKVCTAPPCSARAAGEACSYRRVLCAGVRGHKKATQAERLGEGLGLASLGRGRAAKLPLQLSPS
jgi:hypothetical protein